MHHFPIEDFFDTTCRIVLHCHPSYPRVVRPALLGGAGNASGHRGEL
jgi:hypothetical protein